jgi:hypothetical protein
MKWRCSLVAHRDVVIPREVIHEIGILYLNSTAALLAEKR